MYLDGAALAVRAHGHRGRDRRPVLQDGLGDVAGHHLTDPPRRRRRRVPRSTRRGRACACSRRRRGRARPHGPCSKRRRSRRRRCRGPRRRLDLRVDADNPGPARPQRAAGVPAVDRGVGLDGVGDREAVGESIWRPTGQMIPAVTVSGRRRPSGPGKSCLRVVLRPQAEARAVQASTAALTSPLTVGPPVRTGASRPRLGPRTRLKVRWSQSVSRRVR